MLAETGMSPAKTLSVHTLQIISQSSPPSEIKETLVSTLPLPGLPLPIPRLPLRHLPLHIPLHLLPHHALPIIHRARQPLHPLQSHEPAESPPLARQLADPVRPCAQRQCQLRHLLRFLLVVRVRGRVPPRHDRQRVLRAEAAGRALVVEVREVVELGLAEEVVM